MRASKAISVSLAEELPVNSWPVAMPRPEEREAAARWSLKRLFARKQPTLYQRCLAVHIHHASKYSSLSN
jgi:hypothetical protein